jgi:uncharacterized protein (TIGR00106 family)
MKTTVELQVIPIGSGVSVRKEILRVIHILQGYNFIVETHASGTNIQGNMSEIFSAVENIHHTLHDTGTVRLISYMKIETRTDKEPTLIGKQL